MSELRDLYNVAYFSFNFDRKSTLCSILYSYPEVIKTKQTYGEKFLGQKETHLYLDKVVKSLNYHILAIYDFMVIYW